MYKYRVYGLNVQSNRRLDCYPHSFDAADIVIEFIDNDDAARHFVNQLDFDGEPREISAPEGIGKFYFCGEKHVVVYYQNEDAIERFLVHALLGFGFSYMLMQRKVFLIHGSSVSLDGSAIIIVGGSESGKSSLAAALIQKGCRLISDDTTRLELDAEIPFIYPSYPLRRIYKNTLEYLGIGMEDAFEIITKKSKFALSDNGQKVFLNSESPVKAIVRITPADTPGVTQFTIEKPPNIDDYLVSVTAGGTTYSGNIGTYSTTSWSFTDTSKNAVVTLVDENTLTVTTTTSQMINTTETVPETHIHDDYGIVVLEANRVEGDVDKEPEATAAGDSDVLPQTGGISTSTLVGIAGLALVAVGATGFVIFRKKFLS